jgi:hypothetical protein
MSGWLAAVLVLFNLGLIYFLMAAPLGRRTIRRSVTCRRAARKSLAGAVAAG